MSATTGGALKVYLEGLGLGLPWFRDRAPKNQPYPFGTISEELSLTVVRRAETADELVQVDLWQLLRFPKGHLQAGKVAEDSALVRAVQTALRGAALLAAPTLTYQANLEGSVRLPEPDNNLVHHAFTVRVHRELED